MKSYEQMYLRLKGDIHGSGALYADRFLAGGNSLFGLPSWEEFSKLKLSQIKEWLELAFHQKPLEISVVGDFDKTVVVNTVNRYFGTLPQRVAAQKISHTAITFPKGKHLDIETPTTIEKALLKLVWQTTDYSDIGRTRRLSMLASIVEERVRLAVRERLGASYSPVVYNVSSRFIPDYGTLTVSMILEPTKIEAAKEEVLKICNDLLETGVSSKELALTKEPRLTHIKDRVRSNNYWLYMVLSGSSVSPEQLRWPTTIFADNEAITVEELTDYARQYLRVEDVASVVIRPVH